MVFMLPIFFLRKWQITAFYSFQFGVRSPNLTTDSGFIFEVVVVSRVLLTQLRPQRVTGPPPGVQLVISGDKPQTFVLPGTNPARDYIVAIPEKGDANKPAAKLPVTNIQPDNSLFAKFGGALPTNFTSTGLLSMIGFGGRNVAKTAENTAQKKDDQKN
ncbi:hypothetical protein Ddc_14308 [Ditylenchus destructor]|nr:hypothetical protein Ddc_14308 [Ditylenchus destructor]